MNYFSLYSKLPVWMQNILCSLKGFMLHRQRYGGNYQEIYNQLIESDKWSQGQVKRYKEGNIRKILEHAYETTPFYRSFFDKHGVKPSDFVEMEDIKKFPILTKEMVREHWREMISSQYSKKDLIPYHTSGSTGKALDFFWTKHSVRFYWAVVWRGRQRFGIKLGDLHFNFTGKIVVPLTQRKPPYWRYNRPLNQYMINMQHLTADKVGSILELVNQKKPKFFVGYPSIIHSFASLIEEQGLKVTAKVDYMFTSAEKMYDFQREVIERVFPGVKIVEHYGFSENAASASKDTDMHYHEDFELGLLELKNPVVTPDGVTGELLATGFQNYAMPFIRYEIGDTATFVADGVSEIEGRNEDYILTPEGNKLKRLDYIYKGIAGIKEGQVIQASDDLLTIKIVSDSSGDKHLISSQIKDNIRKTISPGFKVDVHFVDSIERTKSGKFKAVVNLYCKSLLNSDLQWGGGN